MRTAILTLFVLFACYPGARAASHAAPAAQAPIPATHAVLIKGFKFQPDALTVNVGDTIEWTNGDTVPHTATAADKSFDSGSIAPGGKWTFVAKKTGTFPYICTFHPNMKATLIVK